MIALRDVRLEIGDRILLSGMHADLRPGEFVAILGPNGVGKTTMLRAMTGLHACASGSISIDNVAIGDLASDERARRVAFVTSDDLLLDALRVRDVVAIGRFPHHRWWQWNPKPNDERAIDEALRAVQMLAYADRLFTTLSTGERQRVWIAMGLAQSTAVLILDEPTSHLDVHVAHTILGLLRDLARAGKSIVCVLHDLNEAAAYADRLMLLGCGRMLAFDRPDAVLAGEELSRAYGIGMERVALLDGSLRVFAR